MKKVRRKKEKLVLSREKHVPSENIWDYSMLLFGKKKIGKTSMLSHVPKAFFFTTEPGTEALSVNQPMSKDGKPLRIDSLKMFEEYAEAFLEDDYFEVAILDTVDELYNIAYDEVCDRLAIDDPSDEEWGKGWGMINSEMRHLIDLLHNNGKGLIMVSHEKWVNIETWDGEEYEQLRCSLTGKSGEFVSGLVYQWFYYGYEGKNRRLYLQGDQSLDAGHRLEDHYLDSKTKKPLESIAMGKNSKEAYNNLLSAFSNKVSNERSKRRSKK